MPLHNGHNFSQAMETKWKSNHQGVPFKKKGKGYNHRRECGLNLVGLPLLRFHLKSHQFCALNEFILIQIALERKLPKLFTVIVHTQK